MILISRPMARTPFREGCSRYAAAARRGWRHAREQARSATQSLVGRWQEMQGRAAARRTKRRMSVCETVHLGDKRLVALLKIDGRHILVGASGNSVSMLAELPPEPTFSEALRQQQAALTRGDE